MSDSKPETLPPQAQAAWNYPLYDAIMGRRTRRFGLGMEMAEGPFCHRSDKLPVPLEPLETAMLVAAATATTGPILAETEYPGGMVKTIGKPYASAMGSHRARLFFTDDSGTYVVRSDQQAMTKMQEYADQDDRSKIRGFYESCVHKLQDGRMNLPPKEPGLWPHNHWNCNRPGTTLFMPVIDTSKDLIKIILNLSDSKAGRYAKDGGYFIVDDRNGMRPCGNQKWVESGLLNRNKVMTLSRLEALLAAGMQAEGSFMGQLLHLAAQAIGVGGWLFGGFSSTVVLGGTPVTKGLGFRFVTAKNDPFPIPVGIPGEFEGYCPPFFPSMDEAVDAALSGVTMTMDQWEAKGMFKPQKADNASFDLATPQASPEGIACTKDICRYIHETYGKFPGTTDTMQLLIMFQAHHLDLEFYDQHMKPGAYGDTHRHHFRDWHGGVEPTTR